MKIQPVSLKTATLLLFCLLIQADLIGQLGISLNLPASYNGFTLCNNGQGTFLINNCGEIVNHWNVPFPEYYSRLTKDGHLLYISNNRIIERDWNDNQVVNISHGESGLSLTYEVMKLENGNYLAISRRFTNNSQLQMLGWNSSAGSPQTFDGVVEINSSGMIVWEWNFSDHTIQDHNASLSNYGIVSDHPERADLDGISTYDWSEESFMINGMDYNSELDQIVLSVRKMNEIMVIDHSTTTQEAKGTTGGKSGKGGDILYRWGNPQNYGYGSELDRVLYYQHNPNWIRHGEHRGKIIMFNNRLSTFVPGQETFSAVHIIDTPVDNEGFYNLESESAYLPEDADITIDKPTTGNSFYSGYTSGAQVLPNGNIFVTVGGSGQLFEVTTSGEVVWNYRLATAGFIFRSERYSPDFTGFNGKDMLANGTIESPSSSYNCSLTTSSSDLNLDLDSAFAVDLNARILTVQPLLNAKYSLSILTFSGQWISSQAQLTGITTTDLSSLRNGLYLVSIQDSSSGNVFTTKILIPN